MDDDDDSCVVVARSARVRRVCVYIYALEFIAASVRVARRVARWSSREATIARPIDGGAKVASPIAAVFDDVLFSRSQWTDAYRVGVVLARPRRRIARAELKSSRMIKGTERRRRTWRSRIANV